MRKLTDTQSKQKGICYENIRSTGKNNAAAGKRLVMFFLLPEEHGKDSGRQLMQFAHTIGYRYIFVILHITY